MTGFRLPSHFHRLPLLLPMAIRQSTSTSASPSPFQSSHQHEGTPGEVDDSNYIEKSALLDIAFLHSIASHRPIGPHKHFNVIPILLNLDRTARQVGARIRDDGYIRGASGEDTEGENSTTIKKEDMAEGEEGTPIPFTSLPINSQMIWLRLDQLYDVGGLEELVRSPKKVLERSEADLHSIGDISN
jgi:hypothetical protein